MHLYTPEHIMGALASSLELPWSLVVRNKSLLVITFGFENPFTVN